MKRNLLHYFLLILALSFAASWALAETSDNFNSRTGVSLNAVKGYLQGNCWFFSDFDVNRNGWAPHIEGDGAMVSGTGSLANEKTGIYTPLLDFKGQTSVSFAYTFDHPVHDRRWLKLYATDANDNNLFLLDSLELTGDNQTIYHYNKSFGTVPAGQYKLYINYQGIGGEERIAIDQLDISATPHYASACNTAPTANRDHFTGTVFHTATGNVLANDHDANKESLTAYLIQDSKDGRVDLAKNGDFAFTPKDGFGGSSTQFSYKVCDNGSPALCSITTTASIHFPYKSSLLNFQAMYHKHLIDINWNTTEGNPAERFEVERSLDGVGFEKIGEVGASQAVNLQGYAFTDKVTANMARKNDLYYRLRQVDAENRVFYSKVLIVRMYESKAVTAVSVTPDPGVNNIQVNVQLKEKSFVVMRVTDNNGSELIKQTATGGYGANRYDIEGTSQLAPGMYQLEVIINSNERMTMRLAKS